MKITMEKVSIEFPGIKALDQVDFEVSSGEIHALIGANGAGKSTLMKILAGVYEHFQGKILLDKAEVTIDEPGAAKSLGIQMVHQEVDTALVPYLSVGENIMLDSVVNKKDGKTFINWKNLRKEAEEILERISSRHLDVNTTLKYLSLADKQLILIGRALVGDCRFLILDEPTASLSVAETEELFRVVEDLVASRRMGVVFISHRIQEIFKICQSVSILRDGVLVSRDNLNSLNPRSLVERMLGPSLPQASPPSPPFSPFRFPGSLLEVKNLSGGEGRVKEASLSVGAGEIVGIAGLVGAGKTSFCKTLFGARPRSSGEILFQGRPLSLGSPCQAVRGGMALVPEERRKEGVFVEESVQDNLTLVDLYGENSRGGFLLFKKIKEKALFWIQKLKINAVNENQKVAFLSGGNQQKVAIGKWLLADAKFYIFDEPTKGVDVGAKEEIFRFIESLASQGKGVLYASCEFPEILRITHRTYVMYDGRFVQELQTKNSSEEELLFYAAGGKS